MNLLDPGAEPLPRRVAAGLAKVGLALRHRAWREAGARDLTPTQGQVLAFLRFRQGAAAGLGEIASGLAVTAPTASDAVAALERKKLVRKARSREDARSVRIGLTAKGIREADRAAGWPDFLAAAVDTLPPAEQEAFLRVLVRMIRVLQERGEIPVSRMCVTCRYFQPYAHSDPGNPHHCDYVDAPFGDRFLRIDCPDHREGAPELLERNWKVFSQGRLQS